jgi:hypothetical protein
MGCQPGRRTRRTRCTRRTRRTRRTKFALTVDSVGIEHLFQSYGAITTD